MKQSIHSLRKSCIETFFYSTTKTNTRLKRSAALALSALIFALSGCALPTTIKSESLPGATPRKFESVVLLLDNGVFEDLRTFGKVHVANLGDVVEQELKKRGVETGVVVSRLVDLESSTFRQTVWRLKPTHIVSIFPTKRTTSTNLDRVTWIVLVSQVEAGKLKAKPDFRFTLTGNSCVKYKTWSNLEDELNCFRELVAPLFGTLDEKGFHGETALAATWDNTLTSKDLELVRAAIERGDIPWLKKPDAKVSTNGAY